MAADVAAVELTEVHGACDGRRIPGRLSWQRWGVLRPSRQQFGVEQQRFPGESGNHSALDGPSAPALVDDNIVRLFGFADRWDLCRNEDVVVIVTLSKRYNELGRQITTLTAEVFGGVTL